ncbi:MAG: hypothetical protein JW997_02550, partial [Actinobacteria bacterium]|nr:hypothetical protein [Actinomycetota bacterium]
EKDVEKKPEFYRVWPSIKKYIADSIIIAHNASFDLSVLKAVLKVYAIDIPEIYYACTVSLARMVWKDFKNYKLNTVAENLAINFKHHCAKDDAFACASIVIKAARYLNVTSFTELMDKMHLKIYRLN